MKHEFEDGSYLEIKNSSDYIKIHIILGARQKNNPLELIVNAAEIEKKDFYNLLKEVLGPQILKEINKEKENESNKNIEDS